MSIEKIILENLLNNEEYFRKVLPFIQEDYFFDDTEKTIFKFIKAFSERHNKPPNIKILNLLASEYSRFTQEQFNEASLIIKSLDGNEDNKEWLVERTEEFCKDMSLQNAVMRSIEIIDGKDEKLTKEALPSLLQDALSVSFDKSVGHNFFDDKESRWDFYHRKEERVPFHLEMFNKVTKGGLPRKTLSVAMAGINVGKSLFMCDHAAGSIRGGYNVLYITMEMAEERISERIDCNLLDVDIDSLSRMKKGDFISNLESLERKSYGELVVKEYANGTANAGHFRALLDELKMKKKFVPDIIYIDYLNICSSVRYKNVGSQNSYTIIKAIAEELRALAIDYNLPVMSATQAIRNGQGSSDLDMNDVSESIGLPATVDFMFAIIRTDDLDEMGQLLIKQLKSRFNDVNYYRKFVIGITLNKFKLHDVEMDNHAKLDGVGKIDLKDEERKCQIDVNDINFD